jgi:hypothetical protein
VELRSVLAEGARVARTPGRTVVTAQHVADATDKVGRGYLWRACEMMTRGPQPGRLYLQVLTGYGEPDAVAREEHLRPQPMDRIVDDIESSGGTVVWQRQMRQRVPGPPGARRIGRLVVEWQR